MVHKRAMEEVVQEALILRLRANKAHILTHRKVNVRVYERTGSDARVTAVNQITPLRLSVALDEESVPCWLRPLASAQINRKRLDLNNAGKWYPVFNEGNCQMLAVD